jgi:hypothetical protein
MRWTSLQVSGLRRRRLPDHSFGAPIAYDVRDLKSRCRATRASQGARQVRRRARASSRAAA